MHPDQIGNLLPELSAKSAVATASPLIKICVSILQISSPLSPRTRFMIGHPRARYPLSETQFAAGASAERTAHPERVSGLFFRKYSPFGALSVRFQSKNDDGGRTITADNAATMAVAAPATINRFIGRAWRCFCSSATLTRPQDHRYGNRCDPHVFGIWVRRRSIDNGRWLSGLIEDRTPLRLRLKMGCELFSCQVCVSLNGPPYS